MKSTGADLNIQRLLNGTALLAPVMLQSGNQALKGVQIILQVNTPRVPAMFRADAPAKRGKWAAILARQCNKNIGNGSGAD